MLFLLALVSLSLDDLRVPPQLGEPSLEPLPVALEPADRGIYLLGAGDLLMVVVEGGSSQAALASGLAPQAVCTVGSDGMVSVSGLGQVQVQGLSIDEAERQLQILAARFFPRTTVRLSLMQPRLVRVRAAGLVGSPGVYVMYALQRVSDLLTMCGGLAFPASRSGWMYAGGDSTRIDLYIDPETHAPVSDPLVLEGATVVFDACSDPVFVLAGSDSTIQAWDLPEPVPLGEFLETTGGAGASTDLTRSELHRSGEVIPLWGGEGLAGVLVAAGDTLMMTAVRDSVTVGGAVEEPSRVPWRPSATPLDCVLLAGGMRAEADRDGIRVSRDGILIAEGDETLSMRLLPGDAIEVPYSWISRNYQSITLLSALVSLAALISSLSR